MEDLTRSAPNGTLLSASQNAQLPSSFESSALLPPTDTGEDTATGSEQGASFPGQDCESLNDSSGEAKAFQSDLTGIGRPRTKPPFYISDIVATIVSIVCCVFAILVIVNNSWAWHLGYNNQLIVLGFLLSIMNLCLRTVAPMFLCQLEATNSSRLQNYEAILRFQPSISHSAWLWRVVLSLLLALPIGLSVGYKRFAGGTATATMSSSWTEYNADFGMYTAPGLQPMGSATGFTYMLNVTSPVVQASRSNIGPSVTCAHHEYDPADDPPLPTFPQAYGIATLLLDEDRTAILDLPDPTWISRIQSILSLGESLTVSSTVLATVGSRSDLADTHRDEGPNSTFWSPYTQTESVEWDNTGWVGVLEISSATFGAGGAMNSSWAFVSLPMYIDKAWYSFASDATLYTIERMPCKGRWTIAQSGAQLISGSCEDGLRTDFDIHPDVQAPFSRTNLQLNDFAAPQIAENLLPFQVQRGGSRWRRPVLSSTMAGLIWSRAAQYIGPGGWNWNCGALVAYYPDRTVPLANPNLKYSAPPILMYSRPAIQKSVWLYLLFAIQPAMTLLMLLICAVLYTVPIGKFGITAILAGIDHSTLPLLKGSGFSNKLSGPVQLRIGVHATGTRRADVTYHVERLDNARNDRLGLGAFHKRQIELH